MERTLDITIVPVRTPRTQARIVTADLGSKLSSSTNEWCIDREDLANVFVKLKYKPGKLIVWQPAQMQFVKNSFQKLAQKE
jgi:hypothetical protein